MHKLGQKDGLVASECDEAEHGLVKLAMVMTGAQQVAGKETCKHIADKVANLLGAGVALQQCLHRLGIGALGLDLDLLKLKQGADETTTTTTTRPTGQ